jgi:hypothetical protein
MGPAHWDPKAISPFALPGVKKHRLFEELARSFCALDGGMVPFSIFVVTGCPSCGLYKNTDKPGVHYLSFKIFTAP